MALELSHADVEEARFLVLSMGLEPWQAAAVLADTFRALEENG